MVGEITELSSESISPLINYFSSNSGISIFSRPLSFTLFPLTNFVASDLVFDRRTHQTYLSIRTVKRDYFNTHGGESMDLINSPALQSIPGWISFMIISF